MANSTFGSDQTFSLIGEILKQSSQEAYEPLCEIIYQDAKKYVRIFCKDSGTQQADEEDILQMSVYKVIRDLPNFYRKSINNTERQRIAWLKAIVKNTCKDYFKKLNIRVKDVEIDETVQNEEQDNFEKIVRARVEFFDQLKKTFELDTTPDKMMAFVYNRLLFALSGENGSPKMVIESFCGKPLTEMYEQMVEDLDDVLIVPIRAEVLKPLRDKVFGEEYKGEIFNMDSHQISDSSLWIIKKNLERRKREELEDECRYDE